MSKNEIGQDSLIPKFIYLKILEEGEFNGCISTLWFLSLSLVHFILVLVLFLLFLLVLGTQLILSLVPRLLVSVLVLYYILLSFGFVLYACPGFVIVLVFLVPHIKLVYLAFSFLYCCLGKKLHMMDKKKCLTVTYPMLSKLRLVLLLYKKLWVLGNLNSETGFASSFGQQ